MLTTTPEPRTRAHAPEVAAPAPAAGLVLSVARPKPIATGLYTLDTAAGRVWIERDDYETPARRWVVHDTEHLTDTSTPLRHYRTLSMAAAAELDTGSGGYGGTEASALQTPADLRGRPAPRCTVRDHGDTGSGDHDG